MVVKRNSDIVLDNVVNGAPIEVDTFLEVSHLLNSKVDKVEGKTLTTNDYSDIDKVKIGYITINQSINLDDLKDAVDGITSSNTGTISDFESYL
jgi:hypothetical protein